MNTDKALPPWARLAIVVCVLSGCSMSHKPEVRPDAASSVQALQLSGYAPERPEALAEWHEQWRLTDESVNITWLAPTNPQGAPVILYLPGLGESSRAVRFWRETWAQAGYAVLSIQPDDLGRTIYSSREAQAGSFRSLAQRYYAEEALIARMRLVDQTFTHVRQRLQSTLPGIDWQQVIVAGYDLGAQTAAALVGEQSPGQRLPAIGFKPAAAILLSPYVQDMTSDLSRFRAIQTPVLAVTGPRDEDPFNWVRTSGQRLKLWQNVQRSGSYQLVLNKAEHADFSGTVQAMPSGREEDRDHRPKGESGGMGGHSGGMGRLGGGMGKPEVGGGGPGGNLESSPRFGHGQGEMARFDPWQAATIRAVSTAFLDVTIKHSSSAHNWLDTRATSWVYSRGTLEHKP